jgi:hypothetical protein
VRVRLQEAMSEIDNQSEKSKWPPWWVIVILVLFPIPFSPWWLAIICIVAFALLLALLKHLDQI